MSDAMTASLIDGIYRVVLTNIKYHPPNRRRAPFVG
jgi:hypothetical protein